MGGGGAVRWGAAWGAAVDGSIVGRKRPFALLDQLIGLLDMLLKERE